MDAPGAQDRVSTNSSIRSFISRTLLRREKSKSGRDTQTSKGPLGLSTVYTPNLNKEAIADLIFVHGLNGGSQSTWCKGGDPSYFWPRAWLSKDEAFEDVRIHSFGYPSAISRDSILNIRDFARSLLAAIKDAPSIQKDRTARLILVAHSMGGLVVKNASILSRQEPEFHSVFDRISAIFFLATPHQGATMAQTLKRIMSLVPGSRPFIDDLLPQSPVLQSINEDFPRISTDIQLLSFFETRQMHLGVHKCLIVDKPSAVMNVPNERRTLLDADHRGVAMFTSVDDSAYVTVRNAMASVVESYRESRQFLSRNRAQEEQTALARYLGVTSAPEDDIMMQNAARLPGSCGWLSNKRSYKTWREGLQTRFLWLRGRPGAGKSVLSGYIIDSIRQSGNDCCFYFFNAGDDAKCSVNSFLRSLVWQMAALHPEISAKVGQLSGNGKHLPIDKVDHNPVWRRIFFSILRIRLNRPQFWVVDAMDECNGISEAMNYLARIQEQWPVSILVTSRDAVEVHLTNPDMEISTDIITDDESRRDIELFLHSTLKFLPWAPSTRWTTPQDMADQILEQAGGCFLWACLVCSELRDVSTLREIEAVLNNTPSNMDAVYSKILNDMSRARFWKNVAKSVLTWTTYAFRRLSTVEIREPIEMDIQDKIDENVERLITRSCGNLVFVDTHQRVQLIHATAREFLTRSETQFEFTVSKTKAHGRIAQMCLEFLVTAPEPHRRRPDSEVLRTRAVATSPFTDYASNFVFQHLSLALPMDEGCFIALAKFLSCSSVLDWIEYIATNGDLQTVFRAGKAINAFLKGEPNTRPPLGLDRKNFTLIETWGDDLIHLVTRFSRSLRTRPNSIHHLIPPFCPSESAIHRQFTYPHRGLNVLGLYPSVWDECVSNIVYPKGTKPNILAAGPGTFAVGTMGGKIMVYDDSIIHETHVLNHREPVWRLAFAQSTALMASASAKTVRVWETERGTELASFSISAPCLSLTFTQSDSVLRAATSVNLLYEWSVADKQLLGQPMDWTLDFEIEAPELQLRSPMMIAVGAAHNLLSVVYRGEDILLWDYQKDRIHDFYDKDLGSRAMHGKKNVRVISTTVRAIAFSESIDTNRLAAAYADGDLVLFDLVGGKQLSVLSRAYTVCIASSQDGRTLAGVDSHGTITLYDLDSLRPFYKLQLAAPGMVRNIAFTTNNLHFLELRGDLCRVWDPHVLLRQGLSEEDDADPVPVPKGPKQVEYQADRGATITSIFCAQNSNLVFCGKEDGSIHVYGTTGEPHSQELLSRNFSLQIKLLYFDEVCNILASSDGSERVTARKLTRKNVPRHCGTEWKIERTLVNLLRGADMVKQVLVCGRHERLLIFSESVNTLWSIPKEDEVVCVAQIPSDETIRWITHPHHPDCLVLVEQHNIFIHKWASLERVCAVSTSLCGSPSVTVTLAMSLHHSTFFATVARVSDGTQESRRAHVWESTGQDTHDQGITLIQDLDPFSCEIERIIGAFGSRLVMYTVDHWVASLDLKPQKGSENLLLRHFFVPSDWISAHDKLIIGVSYAGEIVFARQSELAIIRRGLEATEGGAVFNPRRGYTQQRTLLSGGHLGINS
ncbi:hypothetical protein F4778DRAFT_384145 [Xylariomycetidae sp. FL2044]|nr:hypothetical protein F4778DRAFT_384145 [Xylariomycetidae sp. FL2044]